jgi:hypothetical protein
MTSKLGENMQREWDEEPLAVQLWEALQARKIDRDNGIAMLTNLAGRGSTLAMMYLGHAYVKGDDRDQAVQGEDWLRRSAQGGRSKGAFNSRAIMSGKELWKRHGLNWKPWLSKAIRPRCMT